jgi:hypothetical protein
MKIQLFAIVLMLTFAALIGSGCASAGRRLEVSAVERIQPGVTTTADVEKMLGRPHEVVTGANGKSVARYYYSRFLLNTDASHSHVFHNPGDVLYRTLSLLYGRDLVIERKRHDESVTPIRGDERWLTLGPVLNADSLSWIQKGKTRKPELVELERLGEPAAQSFEPEGSDVLVWVSGRQRRDSGLERDWRRLVVTLSRAGVVENLSVVQGDLPGLEPNWR